MSAADLPPWALELDGFDGHLGWLPIVCTGRTTHAPDLLAVHYNHATTTEWVTNGPGLRPETFPSTADQRQRARAAGGRVSSDPRPTEPPQRAQRVLQAEWTGSYNLECASCGRTVRVPEARWADAITRARRSSMPWVDVSRL